MTAPGRWFTRHLDAWRLGALVSDGADILTHAPDGRVYTFRRVAADDVVFYRRGAARFWQTHTTYRDVYPRGLDAVMYSVWCGPRRAPSLETSVLRPRRSTISRRGF